MARGIVSTGVHLPYRRLDRAEIRAVLGSGGGSGSRTVASYDEDTTTLGVEAARLALRDAPRGARPGSLWFATTTPAYADKTNATAVHAALRLDPATPAFDANGSVRSAMGALRAALAMPGPALVVTADVRTGLPGGADEAAGGDAGAALLIGDSDDVGGRGDGDGGGVAAGGSESGSGVAAGDSGSRSDGNGGGSGLVAEVLGWGSATEEFLDRWRAPGEARSRSWEERFGEGRYVELGVRAWDDALAAAGIGPDRVDTVLVAGSHSRAVGSLIRKLGVAERVPGPGTAAGDLNAAIGFTGAAHPALLLAAALDDTAALDPAALDAATLDDAAGIADSLKPMGSVNHAGTGAVGDGAAPRSEGRVIALVVLADGADVVVLRTTDAVTRRRSSRPVAGQVATGAPVPYGTYLSWRGLLAVEPPRRPEPARPSASAASRSRNWKFGFVGSRGDDGRVHLPPTPTDAESRPMADATGTIVTWTVDRLAYSPSPPVVFAVVDFDGGGRLPVELTDVEVDEVRIGGRVEMTFRRLFTADGVHNYFWKARPVRSGGGTGPDDQGGHDDRAGQDDGGGRGGRDRGTGTRGDGPDAGSEGS